MTSSLTPDRIAGVLLGTAVGDALGVPRENLSRRRALRVFGGPPLRHQFLFGHGMISDDTEHTCLVGQALLRAPDDPERFARSLGRGLRFWLLALPAGIGRATFRAIVKLWLGFPPTRSGVWSGGNGPAMRSALLGVCLGEDPDRLRAFVRASTLLTHTDPRAERGALLVALAAYHGATHTPAEITGESFLAVVRREIRDIDPELEGILAKMAEHLARDAPATEFADALGLQRGVTGYVYHTVPIALYCWLRASGDFRRVIEEVIPLGGDADTTGAIAGALVGATVGVANIPPDWIAGVWDWPFSVGWMRTLAARLARQFGPGEAEDAGPLRIFWPGLLVRNLFFFAVVLVHIFRRWLPPY